VAETTEAPSSAADGETSPAEDDSAATEDESREPVSELAVEVGRSTSVLVLREAQLVASQHVPELRRAARDIAGVAGVAVAFATAFALGNWAAVEALSPPLPGWRAPLVLAGAWILAGALLLFFVLTRAERVLGWKWWRVHGADQAETKELERARDQAEEEVRESLARLSGAIASEAGVLITAAVVPMAGSVLDAGEGIMDTADEMTDAMAESGVPGGRVVNQAFGVVLFPGRLVVRGATAVLRRGEPTG
jgi:MFS family permease